MKINEIIVESVLNEGARIQHAEDLVFWEKSAGALRAVNNLLSLSKSKDILSIKWDGKPSCVFGRNEDGEFIFTDKAGFGAKGYNGLYKSAKEFVKQKRSKGGDEDYLAKIVAIWPIVQASVPSNYRGFVFGDIMWFPGELKETTKRFIFTPNTVTYEVDKNSELGHHIAQSKAGMAVHTFYSDVGADGVPLKNTAGLNLNGPLCILGPEIKNEATLQADKVKAKQITQYVKKNAKVVDAFLDEDVLREQKMAALPDLLYTYVNAQVKTRDLTNLYAKFGSWVQSNPKISKAMVGKVIAYSEQNAAGLQAVFNIFDLITGLKLDILHQLDSHEGTVIAHIAGARGGEGYVSSDEGGPIKLVNRTQFSQANFARNT